MRRVVLWTVLAAAVTFAGIVALALVQVRPVSLRERITVALASRLNADVEIKTLGMD